MSNLINFLKGKKKSSEHARKQFAELAAVEKFSDKENDNLYYPKVSPSWCNTDIIKEHVLPGKYKPTWWSNKV